jgi:hypothetical protein
MTVADVPVAAFRRLSKWTDSWDCGEAIAVDLSEYALGNAYRVVNVTIGYTRSQFNA